MRAMVAPFFDQDPEHLVHVTILAKTVDDKLVYKDMDYRGDRYAGPPTMRTLMIWLNWYMLILLNQGGNVDADLPDVGH
jgi:hypothetical protein